MTEEKEDHLGVLEDHLKVLEDLFSADVVHDETIKVLLKEIPVNVLLFQMVKCLRKAREGLSPQEQYFYRVEPAKRRCG